MAEMTVTSPSAAMNADTQSYLRAPKLLADIGGTNARFALETTPGNIEAVVVLACQSYPTLVDAIRTYLSMPAALGVGALRVRKGAIAIANPVDGDEVRMTNHHWTFSIEAARRELGFDSLLVVNDFKALAMALPHLTSDQKRQVGFGAPKQDGVIGLLGAGTGLGVSALVPVGDRWIALDSEGGHVTFAPANAREIHILHYAWREYPHVSAERLISGIGLDIVYRALADRTGRQVDGLDVPEIIRRAMMEECAICEETVDCFCEMLGTIAGNLAVTYCAKGGVYIGGGIVPRLGERFMLSGFRRRFEEKGRFSQYVAQVPTYVITAEYPTFLGVSAMLAEI